MKKQNSKPSEDPVQFYNLLVMALSSPGIKSVIITMNAKGELEANIQAEKK